MYLKPVSTASGHDHRVRAEPLGEAMRADHVRAGRDAREDALLLAGEPKRHLDRLVVSDRLQVVDLPGSQCGMTSPVQPWMRNGPRSPPLIAADEAGSCAWMKTP